MTLVESERLNRPNLEVVVESSLRMKDERKEQEAKLRLAKGFAYEIGDPKPLEYDTAIKIKRVGRSNWSGWPVFGIREFELSDAENSARFDLGINIPRFESDSLHVVYNIQEGDFMEGLGFNLKVRIICHEILEGRRDDLRLEDMWLSELEVESDGHDELTQYAMDHYIFSVLGIGG